MAADPQMWKAFIEHLEAMISDRRDQLAPLEAGKMKLGSRGTASNYEWEDITELRAQQIRNEIASIQSTIDRNKHHLE
jgi:hypothetical protein